MITTRRLLPLALAVAFAWAAPAAELEGILIDKMCSAKVLKKGGQQAAAKHKRDCAVNCAAGGYGVITADNKFIAFDAEGSKKAEEALKNSSKADNLRVKVTGEQSGDTIQVQSLELQ